MTDRLTPDQLSILDHTIERAVGNRYCGDSPAMQELVELGLMRPIGKVSWCPDPFFGITVEGRIAHRKAKEYQP